MTWQKCDPLLRFSSSRRVKKNMEEVWWCGAGVGGGGCGGGGGGGCWCYKIYTINLVNLAETSTVNMQICLLR